MEIISNAKLLAINSDLLNIRVICDMILTVESSEGRKKIMLSCYLFFFFPKKFQKIITSALFQKITKYK